jgi:leader peptidase (prepilin peptidase) / N-methyltransferase
VHAHRRHYAGLVSANDFALGLAVIPRWLWVVYAALIGLCVGSFVNVLAWRLPRQESILRRSRCPRCLTPIRWHDNIPLLSFLLLRARCRDCRKRISLRYPIGELASAALCAFAISWFGPTVHGLVAGLFLSLLLVVSVIDGEHMIVPDVVSVPLIATGLFAAWTGSGPPFRSALVAAVAGGLLIALVVIATGGGMGTGDVILAVGLGANLGIVGLVLALWLCFVLGGGLALLSLASGRSRTEAIPYGPCLAVGGAIALFATPVFEAWFLRAFPILLPI